MSSIMRKVFMRTLKNVSFLNFEVLWKQVPRSFNGTTFIKKVKSVEKLLLDVGRKMNVILQEKQFEWSQDKKHVLNASNRKICCKNSVFPEDFPKEIFENKSETSCLIWKIAIKRRMGEIQCLQSVPGSQIWHQEQQLVIEFELLFTMCNNFQNVL